MKQSRFLTIFVVTHVAFILLQIHKHTQIVRHSYKKQEYEQQLVALNEKKEHLTHHLAALKSHEAIQQFAKKELNMEPIKLHHIKKIALPCT